MTVLTVVVLTKCVLVKDDHWISNQYFFHTVDCCGVLGLVGVTLLWCKAPIQTALSFKLDVTLRSCLSWIPSILLSSS